MNGPQQPGKLDPGRSLLIVTDFEPSPIFEALQKQNREVFHKVHPQDEKQHLTFIR